jgi:hypothetical protein
LPRDTTMAIAVEGNNWFIGKCYVLVQVFEEMEYNRLCKNKIKWTVWKLTQETISRALVQVLCRKYSPVCTCTPWHVDRFFTNLRYFLARQKYCSYIHIQVRINWFDFQPFQLYYPCFQTTGTTN